MGRSPVTRMLEVTTLKGRIVRVPLAGTDKLIRVLVGKHFIRVMSTGRWPLKIIPNFTAWGLVGTFFKMGVGLWATDAIIDFVQKKVKKANMKPDKMFDYATKMLGG